jgi:hypothetical protein
MTAPREILIETADGEQITVALNTNPTVGDLKKLIGEREGRDTSTFALRAGPRIIPDDVRIRETEFGLGDVPLSFVESLPRREVTFRAPDGRLAKTRFSKGTTIGKAVAEMSKVFKFENPDNLTVLFNGGEVGPETLLADLDVTKETVLRIEEIEKVLKVVYQPGEGERMEAAAGFRRVVTIGTIRTRFSEEFGLDGDHTGLFLGEDAVPDTAVLAELEIPSDGYLELKLLMEESVADVETPMCRVVFRTPTRTIEEQFGSGLTVVEVKERLAAQLGVEPQQLWISRIDKAADDQLWTDIGIQSNDELVVHVFRPLTIRVPGKGSLRTRFADTATVKSTKEKLSSGLGIPISSISFADLDYSDEDAKLEDLAIPDSRVVSLRDPADVLNAELSEDPPDETPRDQAEESVYEEEEEY